MSVLGALLMVSAKRADVEFVPNLSICILVAIPVSLPVAFGSVTLFELIILVMLVYNAIGSPRRTHLEILYTLQRDGFLIFLSLFVLRLINLIFAVFGHDFSGSINGDQLTHAYSA
ncbi:hypothetical protein BDQ12DRAFT_672059 [Crucibulum laeve]|uniref:Uncharacterized protein n=1 Tax=Crucibulum laeve TaxID=68775 RepID=A0A5C3LGA5_9AGAR|nr:hypothetical protein BDQ12DRAFT_672059 [Crucibulum laeve]